MATPDADNRKWSRSGRATLLRAKKHADDLHTEVAAFINSRPHVIGIKVEPETGDRVWTLDDIRSEADTLAWATIASDVIHNLRLALDDLWIQAVNAQPHGGAFRAFKTRADFLAAFRNPQRVPKTVPLNVIDVLDSLNADDYGSWPLWLIVQLDNYRKHERLVLTDHASATVEPRVIAPISLSFGGFQVPIPIARFPVISQSVAMKKGAELARIPASAGDSYKDAVFLFRVALSNPLVPLDIPVNALMLRLVEEVERAANAFVSAGIVD